MQLPHTQTGTAPETLPRAIPLERDLRDPQGAARMAAQQAADQQRQLNDSAAPRPGQQFHHANLRPSDFGVAFYPNARQDAAASSRTAEAGYGRTVSTQLRSRASLEQALAYYREQFRQSLPKARLEETRQSDAWATLTATDEAAGVRLSVWVQAVAADDLALTLTRWDAATAQDDAGS